MNQLISIELFRNRASEIQRTLEELVKLESPTTEKAAVDRLGDHIRALCEQTGGKTRVLPSETAGNRIVANWGGEEAGFLILCHMDTVFDLGTLKDRPFREVQDRLMGLGVLDMKAGIAIFLSVMQWLHETGTTPSMPVNVLFSADEETGSQTSKITILEMAQKAASVFCLEPGLANGALKTARKGTGEIKLRVKGQAAHAGSNHRDGRNAIEELAHHVLSAQKLTDYDRGTTVNTGLIGGGTRVNVVPDEAWADLDFRVSDMDEVKRLQSWADQLTSIISGTTVQATLMLDRPPMPRNALMEQTYHKARGIAAGIGLNLTEGSTGGGSDANFVSQLGVPVLDGLGGVGDGAHSENEYVLKDSLAERAALLAALLTGW